MGKEYVYYSRISIKEGLDIESEKLHLEIYNKNITKECSCCRQYFMIIKNFKLNDNICDECEKLLEKDDRINLMIWRIWKNNAKYRVFSNLYLQYVHKIMRREDVILQKSEDIDVEKYLNYYE